MKKIKMTETDLTTFIESVKAKFADKKGVPTKITLETNPSTKLADADKVSAIFENEAYKKMQALIKETTKEVGWYGTVERPSEKTFVITDILVCPQTVTATTVTTDDEEFAAWQNALSDDVFNSMRFYGHSHVKMGVTPSGTDDTFQDDILQNVTDFYIFGIFNQYNASWFNIYDVANNILYEKDDIKYEYYVEPAQEWAKEQLKKYVKKHVAPTYTKPSTSNYHAGSYANGYGYGGYNSAAKQDKEVDEIDEYWENWANRRWD